ncbi:MAG: GDP-L-fucose synthase [Verrucomicrobiales bacterium]|nr:GDP-L-fucose synthase [Verrucomicrobiales bacterium]
MKTDDRIYVAGHSGMVGSAIMRQLESKGYHNTLTASHQQLDLTRQADSEAFLAKHRPDVIIIAAAKVGGILANDTQPADFLYHNLSIASNLIHAAYKSGAQRLLFLGSSCIYPREAEQPITEDSLLTGPLETTNQAYAIAKIAGLKLCEFYRRQYGCLFHSAMPCNLYGPGDNYHPQHSHVIPALIRRFHEAKIANAPQVTLWGSGKPRREFLHSDDLSSAILQLLELDNPPDLVNIGAGQDLSIRELAELIAEIVGYQGEIVQDLSKPDGTPAKLMDSSIITTLGWHPTLPLREGLSSVYRDYQSTTLVP